MADSKVRRWCFTLFPTSEDDIPVQRQFLRTLGGSPSVTYIIFGDEYAPTTQRFHFQGFIYFKNARTHNGLKKLHASWHIEPTKGTFAQAIDYCKKEGVFEEYGTAPLDVTEKATKSAAVRWQLAKEGRFEELAPESIKTYEYIYQKYHTIGDRPALLNYWISGPSGCGKSSLVRKHFGDIYWKGMNKWWDGYQHQATTVLDDFDPSHGEYLSYYLKIWADHYAFNAEVKGGMLTIRPVFLVVTSQYELEDCFRKKDGTPDLPAIQAISRRFKKITWNHFFNAFTRNDGANPMFEPNPEDVPAAPAAVTPAPTEAAIDDFDIDMSVFDDNDF